MPVNPDQMNRMRARHTAIPIAVAEAIQPVLQSAATDIVKEMQRECPVSKDRAHGNPQGALRDSIQFTAGGESTPAYSAPGGSQVVDLDSVLLTAGNDRVRYPAFVEYGTIKMAAEPYFWPAIRLLSKRTKAKIKAAFSQVVSDEWSRR
jgi:HK97 gp10 family phage protein